MAVTAVHATVRTGYYQLLFDTTAGRLLAAVAHTNGAETGASRRRRRRRQTYARQIDTRYGKTIERAGPTGGNPTRARTTGATACAYVIARDDILFIVRVRRKTVVRNRGGGGGGGTGRGDGRNGKFERFDYVSPDSRQNARDREFTVGSRKTYNDYNNNTSRYLRGLLLSKHMFRPPPPPPPPRPPPVDERSQ